MSTRSRAPVCKLLVRRLNAAAHKGFLECGNIFLPCAVGRSGSTVRKREGDGATPRGRFGLLYVLHNQKFGCRPRTALIAEPIARRDGWCDAPADRNYNRPVPLPYPASTEQLWRDDGLYDVVVVLDYNMAPRIRNRGSAIFMHVARPGFLPTEGCVALRRADLMRLLARVGRKTVVVIP
jgi:L,D-peptidoglycan transpeptidase YkuD (ErfK/YbiS/YcfS/YnhG family)